MGGVVKALGKTGIPYANYGWPLVTGCSNAGAACDHCYAAKYAATRGRHLPQYAGLAERTYAADECDVCQGYGEVNDHEFGVLNTCGECGGSGIIVDKHCPRGYRWTGEVVFHADQLERPLHTKKPGRVFTVPTGDLFHEGVAVHELNCAFAMMALTPHLTYVIVTKRPERMHEYLAASHRGHCIAQDRHELGRYFEEKLTARELQTAYGKTAGEWLMLEDVWPLPNVWLVPTVWDQESLERVWRLLSETPAAVRGISLEPMLAAVDLSPWLPDCALCMTAPRSAMDRMQLGPQEGCKDDCTIETLDWVICGPETGPGKRPFDPQWAADVKAQCDAAGVPYFDKRESHKDWRELPTVTS